MTYDLIILGGGPAGYLAAERAGHAGLNTLLIEKEAVGGVCLNRGCIPSKTLLHSAKIFDYSRHSEKYGITTSGAKLDHKKVIERKNKVVKALVAGVETQLKRNKVTLIKGIGIIQPKTGPDFTVKVEKETYQGKRLLLATGSIPFIPPIPGAAEGIKKGLVLTNREILNLQNIPKNLTIIGGGVIGLEMAAYFNSAGSKVTVIEMLPSIGGPIDHEIAEILLNNYKKKNIDFKLDSKVTKITSKSVIYEHKGKSQEVTSDKILLSVGRKPNIANLGIENLNLQIKNNAIPTDNTGKTNIPEVYAAGDVNGHSMLAHTAYREAEVCINNMLGKKDRMRYNAVPGVIYTNPEVAGVGETEKSAKDKKLNIEVKKISMLFSGRYMAENEDGDGICKLIINKDTQTLLGLHLIGNPSSEIIYGAALMIEQELRLDDIKELIFPHPTVSEIIREGIYL